MELRAKLSDIDNEMVEIFDPNANILWCVVHKSFFFNKESDVIEKALEAGEEIELNVCPNTDMWEEGNEI